VSWPNDKPLNPNDKLHIMIGVAEHAPSTDAGDDTSVDPARAAEHDALLRDPKSFGVTHVYNWDSNSFSDIRG
jgi:hypothetical protein